MACVVSVRSTDANPRPSSRRARAWRAATLAALGFLLTAPGAMAAQPAPAFSSGFESNNFLEWSHVNDLHRQRVVPATESGIPVRVDGRYIASFEVTDADRQAGKIHSKLYKHWAVRAPIRAKRDGFGRPVERLPGGDPSGTYRAHYFLPPDYRAARRWVNVFQWKEDHGARAEHQDPQWWLNLGRASSFGGDTDAPVLFVNNWGNPYRRYRPRTVPAPLGRWFEIRAELQQRRRIDWYLDGRLFARSRNAAYPIGRRPRTTGWIFGVGHYGGLGRLWVDDVSYVPRSAAALRSARRSRR